jgi:predicted ATPase
LLGELRAAASHLEQRLALVVPQQLQKHAAVQGLDVGILATIYAACTWCLLGYPDRAHQSIEEARVAAQAGEYHAHVTLVLYAAAAIVSQFQRDVRTAGERAAVGIQLGTLHAVPLWLAVAQCIQGWALAAQGKVDEGVTCLEQGVAAYQTVGVVPWHSYHLALLAEAYGLGGSCDKGLRVLAEASAIMHDTGERFYEAEIYRLRGELLLTQKIKRQKAKGKNQKSENPHPQSHILDPVSEAEACFRKAIDVARQQQAKSLELRAVMSLVRLRQQQALQQDSRNTRHESQNRLAEAHCMLAELYNWFTEGFDTKDLREARALLAELKH